MIKTYKDTLNIGEYGEQFFNYDSNEYIADVISYISDVSVDVYDSDLWEWAKDNNEWVEDAILQGFYIIEPDNFDLMQLFQSGQYLHISDTLYSNLDDIVAYVVLEEVGQEFVNKQRLVEVISDTCSNVDNNDTIQYYIDMVRDDMQYYPMLEIHLHTETAWTESILVEGTEQDDLLELIDGYYLEYGDLPTTLYTMDEVLEGGNFKTEYEAWEYIDNMELLPINGGEFFIYGISHVEAVI